jgi:GNAT superfamily N-acetyltransferase
MTAQGTELLVRWATRWDREPAIQLMAALADQHEVSTDPDTLREAFEFALRNPEEYRFAFAERDRQIIGMAALHRSYTSWHGRACGTVEDVYVVEEARREGAATALFEFLHAEARRRGYWSLSLDVLESNESARAFYERFGMKNSGYLVYEMELGTEEG